MPRVTAAVAALCAALAGCAGEEEHELRPIDQPIEPSVSLGIGVSNGGVHASGGLGLGFGNIGLFLGF